MTIELYHVNKKHIKSVMYFILLKQMTTVLHPVNQKRVILSSHHEKEPHSAE